jgi:hypothetical protein
MNMANQTKHEKNAKPSKSDKKVVAAKKKKQGTPAGTCFVLMPFKEPFDTYYSAIIEPAILTVHLDPLRGDSLFRPSPIMADVWQMIQDAKVLVAELTERNANVFYELGLAHAIGKPVILISETIADVPFDLQPLRVLLYNKSDPAWGVALKTNLVSSLRETLGDIARAVPTMFRKIVKSQAPEESVLAMRLFDLERRVAAMSQQSPSVDWQQVSRDLGGLREMSVPISVLGSSEKMVEWTIAQFRKYPPSVIERKLRQVLSAEQVDAVLSEAFRRGKLKMALPRPANPKRARKR